MDEKMIEKTIIEEMILKHKNCRMPHDVDGHKLSCLVMILAEIKGENPVKIAKEIGLIV